MPLKNTRVTYLGQSKLVVYSDCPFTSLGISELIASRFPTLPHNDVIIVLDSAAGYLDIKMADIFRIRKIYGDHAYVFVLSHDDVCFEVYDRIHFISLKAKVNDLACYIMCSLVLEHRHSTLLSLQSMQIIYMKSRGMDITDIALIMNKSRSTIKNNFSYCKRRLNIKNLLSERALIYIAKGIVS